MMPSSTAQPLEGVEIAGSSVPGMDQILTTPALRLIATLQRRFDATRRQLLIERREREDQLRQGAMPDFLPETESIRNGDWRIASVPDDLQDRRVEITGPVDRKMVINALNSGAKVFMADFEDAHSPTWEATIAGQVNLRDAINGTIEFTNPQGKQYRLNSHAATLLVRPRGWHLVEKHLQVDGQPVSASIFDFALYLLHNAQTLNEKGSGPYFYLPKLEHHLEARLWNDVFVAAQEELDLPVGTIKATVLIETILAAFQMDEILYELRDHIVGLNCGRWDYIFSIIKKFRHRPDFVMPDRAQVTMTAHMMHSYSLLAIKTCHRRGAHAIGGMAAQIPIKGDPQANEEALAKVRADKQREAGDGHDGTWVAHPGLIPTALEAFDAEMPRPNQVDRLREDVQVTAKDLLTVPEGQITEAGLRVNVNVGLRYLAAWLDGNGCVPIFNLMEDAATCEISRAQVWQWIRHDTGRLDDGTKITVELFRQITEEELRKIQSDIGPEAYAKSKFDLAHQIFDQIIVSDDFVEFLTLPAYEYLD
jgi:malate synthase